MNDFFSHLFEILLCYFNESSTTLSCNCVMIAGTKNKILIYVVGSEKEGWTSKEKAKIKFQDLQKGTQHKLIVFINQLYTITAVSQHAKKLSTLCYGSQTKFLNWYSKLSGNWHKWFGATFFSNLATFGPLLRSEPHSHQHIRKKQKPVDHLSIRSFVPCHKILGCWDFDEI